jgi:exopolysaccharide biosynthesis polyprenyl glycosylphosphotransferase
MKYPPYKILLAIIDYTIIRLTFSVAFQFHGISLVDGEGWLRYLASSEFLLFFLLSLVIILFFQSNNLYKINVVLSRSLQLVIIIHSFFYVIVGLAAIVFFIRSDWILESRSAVAYFGIFGALGIASYRLLIFRPLYIYLNKKEITGKNVVIVGSNIAARNLAIQMELDYSYGFHLIGFVDDTMPAGTEVFEKYELLGTLEELPKIVAKFNIDEIIVTVSETDHKEMFEILDVCKQTTAQVMVTSSLFDVVNKKVYSERYFNIPIVRLTNTIDNKALLMMKRLFDIVGSSVGLLLLSIPLIIIAMLVKLSSKGPILYKQIRVGKEGSQFYFYKFRSMYIGSDQDEQRIHQAQDFIKNGKISGNGSTKVVNEEMITPVGRFLRKTSLDELPQFFNVLKGDMSLVGPRPCLPYEYEAYNEWHKRRLSILPGCTGLWQVSSRSEVGFDDMVLLDLYYIDNYSPWLDLQLILKTIPVMFSGKGGK